MAHENQDQDQDQDQEQDQEGAKTQRRILIGLGVVAVAGYAVMAAGLIRGQDGAAAPLPGGAAAQAWFDGLTGVDPRTITATYASGRTFRWVSGWTFTLDAGEQIVLALPATTSRWTQTRTLGVRLRPGAEGQPPRARIVYRLQDPRDPAASSDLAPKLLGDANALVLPRKPAGQESSNPAATLAARLRPSSGSSGGAAPPEDLAQGKMALLLAAATVTITSQADDAQIVEIF